MAGPKKNGTYLNVYMKRRSIQCACFCVLLVFAVCMMCGFTAPFAQEDAEIRAAMQDPSFGFGDKLAAHEPAFNTYSFHGVKIPEELRAQTADEIGAYISYHELDVDENGDPIAFTVTFAFDESLTFFFFKAGDTLTEDSPNWAFSPEDGAKAGDGT